MSAAGIPIELHTDPRKLRQILVNVLANAVKFTDTGDVSLSSRVEGEAEDAIVTIYFEVTDTGRGMSLADQEHAFEPFWQADPTSTKSGEQRARAVGGTAIRPPPWRRRVRPQECAWRGQHVRRVDSRALPRRGRRREQRQCRAFLRRGEPVRRIAVRGRPRRVSA